MPNNQVKVTYVIVGPTASGKSATAVELAKKVNGEIISADSVQIYRGLDIASGKITPDEMQGIPHHLIDVIDPETPFSAEDFRRLGNQALDKILSKKKIPIITGGTGFYIDTLVYNRKYPHVHQKIRNELSGYDLKNLQDLAIQLGIKDKFNRSDFSNKLRLVSKISLFKTHGHIPEVQEIKREQNIHFQWLGINPEPKILKNNIIQRTDERLEADMIEEVKKLLENGVSANWLQSVGLEYRHIVEHLKYGSAVDELRQKIIAGDLQYAKRQLTWFKKNKQTKWFSDKDLLLEHFIN